MSAGNGRIPIVGHRPAMKKDSDLITVGEARDLVIQECVKVHEHYLTQIPKYMAQMIQEALVHHKLVTVEQLLAETQPVEQPAPADMATDGGDEHPAQPS